MTRISIICPYFETGTINLMIFFCSYSFVASSNAKNEHTVSSSNSSHEIRSLREARGEHHTYVHRVRTSSSLFSYLYANSNEWKHLWMAQHVMKMWNASLFHILNFRSTAQSIVHIYCINRIRKKCTKGVDVKADIR